MLFLLVPPLYLCFPFDLIKCILMDAIVLVQQFKIKQNGFKNSLTLPFDSTRNIICINSAAINNFIIARFVTIKNKENLNFRFYLVKYKPSLDYAKLHCKEEPY